jgi:hypothetical protein
MAESENNIPEITTIPVEKTSRLKSFRINHPRTAKVTGIVAVTAVTLGAVTMWKNRKRVVDLTETSELEDSFETSS